MDFPFDFWRYELNANLPAKFVHVNKPLHRKPSSLRPAWKHFNKNELISYSLQREIMKLLYHHYTATDKPHKYCKVTNA